MPLVSTAQSGRPVNSQADSQQGGGARESEKASKTDIKSGSEDWFAVIRVVDGDTFWVDNGSEKGLKIRLIGVDRRHRVTPHKPKGDSADHVTSGMLTGKKSASNMTFAV